MTKNFYFYKEDKDGPLVEAPFGCEFEIGYKNGDVIHCGKPAVGQNGRHEGNRTPLCQEHLDYAVSLGQINQPTKHDFIVIAPQEDTSVYFKGVNEHELNQSSRS